MAPGGTSTTTSVFNMVLNTVGASSFASTLNSVQSGINSVVASTNKASQAAATGKVNAELQALATAKLQANLDRANASLDVFRIKVMESAQETAAAADRAQMLEGVVGQLSSRLEAQVSAYASANASSDKSAQYMDRLSDAIQRTQGMLSKYEAELKDANATVVEGTSKEALYQAQLKAREARIASSTAAMEGAKAPLNAFESALATIIQVYNAVDKVERAIDRWSLTVARIQRIFEKLKDTVDTVTGKGGGGSGGASAIGQAAQADLGPLMLLETAVGSVSSGLGFLGQAAATAFGTMFANAVQGAIGLAGDLLQQVEQLGQSALTASGDSERFVMSLRAMIGVERAGADATLNVRDAIAQSSEEAAGLYQWTIKLGILSPFTIQAAKDVLQLAISFGYSTQKAMELTQATFDWGAATGKTSADVEQVGRMLGQLNALGTFNGRVLRELGTTGITLNNVLQEMAKQTGKTVEQLRAMQDQGEITAEMGENAILGFMHKFDGAAKDQAGTIQGLIESLGEMGPELAKDFFGPVDAMSDKVGGVIGSIQTEMKHLVDFLQQDWVPKILTLMGNGLGGISDRAFAWGENVVTQFAQGMLAGLSSLMDSIIQISNVVAYWLSPGSPPRALPDIGKWGQSAINEFFKGFSMADFSVFDSLSGDVEKHLRGMTLIKEPSDKVPILNSILGERSSMAAATAELDKFGKVSEATFQNIFASMGGASQELQSYIRNSFALEIENRKLTDAQNELDKATQKYNDLLKPVNDQIQKITDAQTDLRDEQQKTMLELILKDPNATQAEKAQARLEIDRLSADEKQRMLAAEAKTEVDAAQAKVDAETAKQKAMQDTLSTQKALLTDEESQVALMQEYYDLLKQIAAEQDAAKAGGGGGGGQPLPLPDPGGGIIHFPKPDVTIPKWLQDLIDKFNLMKTAAEGAWTNITKKLQPVEDAFKRLGDALGDLRNDFLTYVPEINEWIGKLVAWTVTEIGDKAPHAIDNLTDAVKHLQGFWDKNHKLIEAIAEKVWKIVIYDLLSVGDTITWLIDLTAQFMDHDWAKIWKDATKKVQDFIDFIKLLFESWADIVVGVIDILGGILTGNWTKYLTGIVRVTAGILSFVRIAFDIFTGALHVILSTFFSTSYTNLKKWVQDISDKFTSWFSERKIAWDGFWNGGREKLQTEVGTMLGNIVQWFTDTLAAFATGITPLVKAWGDFWSGDDTGLKKILGDAATALLKKLGEWFTDMETAFSTEIPNFLDAGKNLLQGLIDGAGQKAQQLIDAVVGPITDAIDQAKKLLNINSPSRLMAKEIGAPMMEGIAAGISNSVGMVQNALNGALSASVEMVGGGGSVSSNSYTNNHTTNFNYSPTYNGSPMAVSDNFALMQSMV